MSDQLRISPPRTWKTSGNRNTGVTHFWIFFFFPNQRTAFFLFKVSPILRELSSFVWPPTDQAHILALASGLSEPCCHLSNCSLCPFSLFVSFNTCPLGSISFLYTPSPGCSASRVLCDTPGQQPWHLCSCLVLMTKLCPLCGCPCSGSSFVLRPRLLPPLFQCGHYCPLLTHPP